MAQLHMVGNTRSTKERREAAEALAESDDKYLECRDLRHSWQLIGCFYVSSDVHRKLRCARCKTEATDVWTGKGERIRREYKYPQGYQVKGVRIVPIDVRREVLTRTKTIYSSEKHLLNSLFGRQKRA